MTSDVRGAEAQSEPGLKPLPPESALLKPDDEASTETVESFGDQPLPEGHRAFLWQVHSYVNGYIRLGDTKAGLALAFDLAVLGALYGAGYLTSVGRSFPWDWNVLQWTSGLSAVLSLAGALAAAWAVRPRLPNPQPRGFIFWESIRAHATAAEFHNTLAMQTEGDLDRQLAEHLHVLANVASQKYYWTAWSVMISIGAGLLACVRFVVN